MPNQLGLDSPVLLEVTGPVKFTIDYITEEKEYTQRLIKIESIRLTCSV